MAGGLGAPDIGSCGLTAMAVVAFATNREPRPRGVPVAFGRHLNSESPGALRFGWATVKDSGVDLAVAEENLVEDGSGVRVDENRSVLGSRAVFCEMRCKMTKKRRDALVYIHGYNIKFREGLRAADRLATVLGPGGPFVALFSWPSDGSVKPWLAYASDRRDAAASGPAVGRAILKLMAFLRGASRSDACRQRAHLLAHSMGVYVLRHALQTIINESSGVLPRIFDEIVLVAGDEDDDAFEHDHKLRRLPELGKKVHVYFNEQDVAMAFSDRTKGNPTRLGGYGLRLPFQTPSRVTQIDCTPVISGLVEHGYHLREDAVVADIGAVLVGTDARAIPNRRFVAERNCYQLVGAGEVNSPS